MKKQLRYLDAARDAEALSQARILYTDLDGTLLGRAGCLLVDGEGRPSARTAAAIVSLNQLGTDELTIMPCTGRSVTQLLEITRLCGWHDFIAEVGAIRSYWDAVSGTRETLFDTPEWPAEAGGDGRTPLEIIEAAKGFERLMAAFPGQLEYHAPWNVNRQATNVLRGRLDYARAQALLADITPSVTLVENGVIAPTRHGLDAAPLEAGGRPMPIHAYHLVPAGTSKCTAIQADLRRRDLTRDQAIMVGDGLADLQCAPAVGLCVLVQNALTSHNLNAQIAATPNARLTVGARGDGWVSLAAALLTAKAAAKDTGKSSGNGPADLHDLHAPHNLNSPHGPGNPHAPSTPSAPHNPHDPHNADNTLPPTKGGQ
jgi:hydroxymethylpyrimidine pyrophosphatase-like HAD family hydrolase